LSLGFWVHICETKKNSKEDTYYETGGLLFNYFKNINYSNYLSLKKNLPLTRVCRTPFYLRVLLTSVLGALFKHSKRRNYFINKIKYFNFQCIDYINFRKKLKSTPGTLVNISLYLSLRPNKYSLRF